MILARKGRRGHVVAACRGGLFTVADVNCAKSTLRLANEDFVEEGVLFEAVGEEVRARVSVGGGRRAAFGRAAMFSMGFAAAGLWSAVAGVGVRIAVAVVVAGVVVAWRGGN